jgi:hypothetical protein
MVVLALLVHVAAGPGSQPAHVRPALQDDISALEAETVSALQSETSPFAGRALLVARLQAAYERSSEADRPRLALLWLRGMRWLLAAIPMGAEREEPYRRWLEGHEPLVVYSEPAGQWLIEPDVIWRVHGHAARPDAEALAWLAVENGMPGECEGYVPCTAYMLDRLYGEYLRRHPSGAHAAEAAAGIRESFAQSLRLLADPDGADFLDRRHDCGELASRLDELRKAILGSSVAGDRDTLTILARLRAVCP